MENKDSKELKILKIVMFILPFIFGIYYEFTAFLTCAILCTYLIYLISKRKSVKLFINVVVISIIIFVITYLLVTVYSIDKGMAFVGFLKIVPIIPFLVILMQFEKEQLNEVFSVIPYSGGSMVLICIGALLFPNLKESFYMADRLGGFFQYSNTFALFLLIGFIVIGYKKEIGFKEQGVLSILLVGILMTGSRSVFVVTVISLIVLFIRNKDLRKFLMTLSIILFVFSIIFVAVTESYQSFGRFLTISSESSTLLGRLLYYKDGIRLFMNKPLGLGYMGYYYMEPLIQTGEYSIKYIHNDFLQIALDAGIIAAIAFIISIVSSLFSKGLNKMHKHVIIVIAGLSVFDFNLQFLIVFLILIMALDYRQASSKIIFIKKRRKLTISYGVLGATAILSLYFFIAFFAEYKESYKIAAELYPGNTVAKTKLLLSADSKEKARDLADDILERNKMSYLSYNAKALVAAMDGKFEDMVFYKKKTLNIAKYSINEYEDYIKLLARAINYYERVGDDTSREKYVGYIKEVPNMLRNIEEQTDELAFKVKDKPNFELSEQTKKYIEFLGGE
ncbi:O-antigen ligase family protein [Clostridium cibarium]|uniref:O-antigen ligase family protein n=1 Tax=Clostridium cibarium TaxID=2762247 RepID=A0ABR8PPZ5_9CLOT|nr:O-antigen ligase family protein [Clostridium cibarium]MBD7910246.1 O-antigen ligase family protein [Clostridium cibarium]